MSPRAPSPELFNLVKLAALAEQLDAQDQSLPSLPHATAAVTRQTARRLISQWETLLFPLQHPANPVGDVHSRLEQLGLFVWDLAHQVHRTYDHACPTETSTCQHLIQALEHAQRVASSLPHLQALLWQDIEAAFRGDPAATGPGEIIATYPGFYAIMVYRLAHQLFLQGVLLLPRLMTEVAHSVTGIDIHPGASVGPQFFIDHGTGVVIGETTVIGTGVTLYQGVTLGAVNFPRDHNGQVIRGQKRHPTIEDNVVIYSGATILGGETVIGAGSIIGGNVWLTQSVPAGSKVLSQPDITFKAAVPKI